ncbi:MAG: hypothetical protein Q7P63_02555 [Verrucomicrobiota bacterium JB022]|nr:hypothetical protein [Verrucomicrobiota bacterium JB022]
MNKSLLVMICDFLLISILALVRFDDPPEDEPAPQAQAQAAAQQGQEQDMVEVLRMSLEEEEARRQALAQNLEQREAQLQEREQALQQTSEELTMTREERERLAAERERLAQEREQLASSVEQLEQTRAEREQELQRQQEQARQLQAELKAQQDALAESRAAAERLAQAQAEAEQRAQLLQTNLQVSQTESRILRENLDSARAEVETARVQAEQAADRAERLSTNVAQLAQTQQQSTQQIQKQIEEAQPINQNEIFKRFEANRVRLAFSFQRPQLLGGWSSETSQAPAVLVQDASGQTYALVEASMTPFDPTTLDNLRAVRAQMRIGDRTLSITEIGFLREDPRVISIALPDRFVQAAEKTPFMLAREPLRFPQAVLVGQQQDRYGEVGFRVSSGANDYINLDSRVLSRLFGDFAPVRGDFVFAKTGHLMGVMVSNGQGVVLQSLESQAYLPLGDNFQLEQARRLKTQLTPQVTP